MIGRRAFLGLLAVLVVALAPGAAATASAAAGGSPATATPSKSKGKKGKGKKGKSSCKGKKGKAKKNCLRKQKNKNKGKGKSQGKLANGGYADERNGVAFKVTGGGTKIQLEKIALRALCVPQEAGSGNQVPLKSRKSSLVASETFQVVGGGTLTVSWSAEINPNTLRYTIEYEATYELNTEGFSGCEGSDRLGGTLSH